MNVIQTTGRIHPPKKQGDAGYDISVTHTIVIPPVSSVIVDCGVAVQPPVGWFAKIFSRSGLSTKNKVEVGAGIIDAGYTGNIKIHLYNYSSVPVTIPPGIGIGQLVLLPLFTPPLNFVDSFEQTDRGCDGFGSTDCPAVPGEKP